MEYILDELKQYVIKEVDEFAYPSQNYLIIYYISNKIRSICLISNSEHYEKNIVGSVVYNGITTFLGTSNEIYIVEKKINYEKFVEIMNNVILIINNNSLNVDTDLCVEPYLGDYNYICKYENNEKLIK